MQSFVLRAVVGLLILLPGIFICASTRALPTLSTLDMSRKDQDLFRDEEAYIGAENYDRLRDDERFADAILYTLRLTAFRVLIVAVVPIVVGVLIGLQGAIGRNINRLLLTVVGVFISPLVFAVLVPIFFGQTWDFDTFDPSPLGDIPDWISLRTQTGAQNVVNLTDGIVTLGIALAVGGTAFAAVMRGRRTGQNPALAFISVWLIGGALALVSAAHTLTLPLVMTNGRAAATLPFLVYRYGLVQFQMGYGAALASVLIVFIMAAGTVLWVAISFSNLRLSFTQPEMPTNNRWSLASLPVILGLSIPVLGLILWGFWLVSNNGGFDEGSEFLDLGRTFSNTVAVPWLTIWFVQLPVAYLVGFSLGFVRPLGKWASNVMYLPFVIFALMPAEILGLDWLLSAREAGTLNTEGVLSYEWQIGIVSLLLFKLFFDGAHENYASARASGQSIGDSFLWKVFLPSIPIGFLVGAVLSFMAMHSLVWPLFSIVDVDKSTIPVHLMRLRGLYATDFQIYAGATLLFSGLAALIFLPVFAVLQVLVVDRLGLVAGKPQITADTTIEVVEA